MKILNKYWLAVAGVVSVGTLVVIATLTVSADVPAPVLRIQALGSNQFSITITNGVTNINYEVYWTPAIGDPGFQWQLLDSGAQGETNWTYDVGTCPVGFFRVSVGNDWDGDGVLNWMDASPLNSGLGSLSITIDSPLNGFTFN